MILSSLLSLTSSSAAVGPRCAESQAAKAEVAVVVLLLESVVELALHLLVLRDNDVLAPALEAVAALSHPHHVRGMISHDVGRHR